VRRENLGYLGEKKGPTGYLRKKMPEIPEEKSAWNTRGKGLPGVTEEKPLGAE